MLEKFPQILIIPIDNRPVCYDLPIEAAKIFDGTEIFVPDITLLGGLKSKADTEKILGWAKHILLSKNIDIAIISLDTIAYGGLVPSRKTQESFEQIKENIDNFVQIINTLEKKVKIYAISSIMRISDNNCNEEEKSYWETYGRDLFRYSYLSHKLLKNYDVEIEAELIKLAREIPFEIIDDYLDTRKRNFDINSYYIDLTQKGLFDKLIFSQDDTAEFGFNVEEKELLQIQAIKEQIVDKVIIKTGADEMILSLLCRSLMEYFNEKPEIQPIYFKDDVKKIIPRYEDKNIETSIKETIELCGAKESKNSNTLKLLVNAPNKIQNDLCLEIYEDENSNKQAQNLIESIPNTNKYLIADIKNANGADNFLVENILGISYDNKKFYGFSAWNTTGNTLGTVISIGLIKYLAEKFGRFNEQSFKKIQFIRFLDDWAYQANVRKILRQNGSPDLVSEEMQNYLEKISNYLSYKNDVKYEFPWDRTFEIKIKC